MFNFEKLEVWQKSIALADVIYHETRSFPVDERFGLTNQMRRSVVSVSSNIAEGSSRSSKTISDALLRLGRAPSLNWFLSRLSPSDKTSCQKRISKPSTAARMKLAECSAVCEHRSIDSKAKALRPTATINNQLSTKNCLSLHREKSRQSLSLCRARS